MSTVADILRVIEQRAEQAIVHELHQMLQEVLVMRTALVLNDRAHADALLWKIDRLIDDQAVRPATANDAPPMSPQLSLDELLPLSPSDYEVRFFDRGYGDLEDVAVVESFALALQLATDRHKSHPEDRTEAAWSDNRGSLTVRSHHGTVLLHIEAIEKPMPAVQPHVARACQALENGEPAAARQLFTALRQAA